MMKKAINAILKDNLYKKVSSKNDTILYCENWNSESKSVEPEIFWIDHLKIS